VQYLKNLGLGSLFRLGHISQPPPLRKEQTEEKQTHPISRSLPFRYIYQSLVLYRSFFSFGGLVGFTISRFAVSRPIMTTESNKSMKKRIYQRDYRRAIYILPLFGRTVLRVVVIRGRRTSLVSPNPKSIIQIIRFSLDQFDCEMKHQLMRSAHGPMYGEAPLRISVLGKVK
jgi:hypothetical protein